MKKIYVAVVCAALLIGCKPSDKQVTSMAEKEISMLLKEPDSARFVGVVTKEIDTGANGKSAFCVYGYVNGKNSFGAYSGASPFAITMVSDTQLIPFMEPDYKVASKVISQNDGDTIRYLAIRKLCD